MGHLPALAVPRVETALVICFGTGQTADAVRRHAPERLASAEISPAVIEAAPLFERNHGVLDDRRVHVSVMDGRAFLRRTPRQYDLVTLEPMPPNFAGVNNLYSEEFYTLVRDRLRDGGVATQWLPMHLIAPSHMRAIVATFVGVFPESRLWIDPVGGTGILVGGTEAWSLRPADIELELDPAAIEGAFILGPEELGRLAEQTQIITDDNQMLSYGLARLTRSSSGRRWYQQLYEENMAILRTFEP
jgi:spermidine synthase